MNLTSHYVSELRYLAWRAKTASDSNEEQEIVHALIPAIMRRANLRPMDIREADAHREKILRGEVQIGPFQSDKTP